MPSRGGGAAGSDDGVAAPGDEEVQELPTSAPLSKQRPRRSRAKVSYIESPVHTDSDEDEEMRELRAKRKRAAEKPDDKPVVNDPTPLSEYEIARLENIRKNQEMLQTLGLAKPGGLPTPPTHSRPPIDRPPVDPTGASSRACVLPANAHAPSAVATRREAQPAARPDSAKRAKAAARKQSGSIAVLSQGTAAALAATPIADAARSFFDAIDTAGTGLITAPMLERLCIDVLNMPALAVHAHAMVDVFDRGGKGGVDLADLCRLLELPELRPVRNGLAI